MEHASVQELVRDQPEEIVLHGDVAPAAQRVLLHDLYEAGSEAIELRLRLRVDRLAARGLRATAA